ncbi:GntR family transcriptional regulator [Amylibacter marinus]|uniref:GntR family transcriptional regulator n=1 Tax=Amylibacter marinus TaxID=1475483 RepID=A0ABQ5VY89_9RHOB|nr:FCD domain-containing protein [Amylibacter marinus]GLQ36201.1 GntR family transcriptional regulator [Amylibacter marinus]
MSDKDNTDRAADLVVRQLSLKIQSGELKDGQTLPAERDLMEEFGISRTVVREAVVALSNKGLVEARPRYRPVVRKPGYDAAFNALESIVTHLLHEPGGVKNLFDTRIMIESMLVREAAKDADKSDIARLKEALAANKESIENSAAFYQTDIDFHKVLYGISRNPVLPAINKAYTTWLAPHWSKMPRLPSRNEANYQAHLAIFDAILMRDADLAEAALRDHLQNAWSQVRETFGDI